MTSERLEIIRTSGLRTLILILTVLALSPAASRADSSAKKARQAQTAAITAATDWLLEMTPEDPVAYLSLALIGRRFGVEQLEVMEHRYLAALEGAKGREERRLRAFLPILEADAPVEPADIEAIDKGFDVLTGRALNCRSIPLPSDFELKLRQAMTRGGYWLTHSALALQWLEENDCSTPWSRRLRTLAVQQMAQIPEIDLRLTDLELEAATFLVYMDAEQLLPPGFYDTVLEAQRPDGSWAGDSALDEDTGHWHATSLALWILLEKTSPDALPIIPR